MAVDQNNYNSIKKSFIETNVTLVAVSKTKPAADILELYNLGHRDFGENYVQELVQKQADLPKDIRWHFIGHLQTNKVKLIAPFVQLIQGVDSLKLLQEVNKQAQKAGRVIDCLLQVYIAREETKFGLDENEVAEIIAKALDFSGIRICGLMGMASFTDDVATIKAEFHHLKEVFDRSKKLMAANSVAAAESFKILSMGMSSDYKLAIACGSNMVRIGSLLFGERVKP